MVEGRVVIEVKAERYIQLLDHAQVQTYLKILQLPLGLILNFNTQWLKNGIARIINPTFLL